MAASSGDRSAHFPAIEKKHGKPVAHWFALLARLGHATYPQQMAALQEKHGFSRTHANALVMHHRGSTTSRRHASPDDFYASVDPAAARTARAIFRAIRSRHTGLDLVIAWNQPMLRTTRGYVFGLSVAKNHLTLNPFSGDALALVTPMLTSRPGCTTNKKTFTVPIGWKPDVELLDTLVSARLEELDQS